MPAHSRKTILLATDQQRSVLNALDANRPHPIAYTPYGHHPLGDLLSLLGFNGELPDPLTGHYHLGSGSRQFNPVLMRFNSPDSLSPFGKGGRNAYAYCEGDPRIFLDPSGHMRVTVFSKILKKFRESKHPIDKTSKAISHNKTRNTIQIKNARERARRVDMKELSERIKLNESTIVQNEYTITNKITDITNSAEGYELAKVGYGFTKYPDPAVKHTWLAPNGAKLLDTSHFDVTINHYRNMKSSGKFSKSSETLQRAIILRAAYIENFTEINLMGIKTRGQ